MKVMFASFMFGTIFATVLIHPIWLAIGGICLLTIGSVWLADWYFENERL